MNKPVQINVNSEIGELEAVILHTPGPEIENMTPENAERALYSDILNLSSALKEYKNLEAVLGKVCKTFKVRELLEEVLTNSRVKEDLLRKICSNESVCDVKGQLEVLDNREVARQLIEGVDLKKDNLTKFLSKQRFALRPLHNFFFTRDASISYGEKVLIARMASKVRERESIIMEAIFDYHPSFKTATVNPQESANFHDKITIEGGDILIAKENIILVGKSARTSSYGIDYLIERLKAHKDERHIIVQELPATPESFIHLDMVFTFIDKEICMVYEPIILKPNRYQTVHISISKGQVTKIREKENILIALKDLGMDFKPILCGGSSDPWIQQREQWHSGANFFAMAPGKLIGYDRNIYTIEELSNSGFEIIEAQDIISDKLHINEYNKCVVTIPGSELPRGGGGARCMTMPVVRKDIEW